MASEFGIGLDIYISWVGLKRVLVSFDLLGSWLSALSTVFAETYSSLVNTYILCLPSFIFSAIKMLTD